MIHIFVIIALLLETLEPSTPFVRAGSPQLAKQILKKSIKSKTYQSRLIPRTILNPIAGHDQFHEKDQIDRDDQDETLPIQISMESRHHFQIIRNMTCRWISFAFLTILAVDWKQRIDRPPI